MEWLTFIGTGSRPELASKTGLLVQSSEISGSFHNMSWTEQKIQMLKEMWGHGFSASEIAKRLGGLTRNAVIGKAHRLKLSSRPSPIRREDETGRLPLPPESVASIVRSTKRRTMLRPLPPVALPSTVKPSKDTAQT